MYINNDYGIGVKDTFVQAFEAAGGKVLIAQPFELGGKDFRTEVLKVKATNPKVIFIVDHVAEGSIVIKQAKELGMETQWVTDVSMVAKEVIDLAGAAAEGAMGLRAGSTADAGVQGLPGSLQEEVQRRADHLVRLRLRHHDAGGQGHREGWLHVGWDPEGTLRGRRDLRRAVGSQEVRSVRDLPGRLRVDDRQGRSVDSSTRRNKGSGAGRLPAARPASPEENTRWHCSPNFWSTA